MTKYLLICFTLFITINSYAKDGSSGCRPGWYISSKNSLLSSLIRATTNGILAPTATTGMTFGTSNSSKHSIVKREEESLKFSTENYFEMAANSAKGNGKYLAVYAQLIGCDESSVPVFKKEMKINFNKLFLKDDINPQRLLNKTLKVIFENKELQQACLTA
jgi:hypothetical protein